MRPIRHRVNALRVTELSPEEAEVLRRSIVMLPPQAPSGPRRERALRVPLRHPHHVELRTIGTERVSGHAEITVSIPPGIGAHKTDDPSPVRMKSLVEGTISNEL